MSPRPTKAESQAALAELILEVAWSQIAAGGLDAINLRAIGRALGITAPAIYHYYPDRSALLQALRQQYLLRGSAQLQQAWRTHGVRRAHMGVYAVCDAYRTWAMAMPHAYLVLFAHDPDHNTPPDWMMQLLAPFAQAVEALRQQNQMRMRTNLVLTAAGQVQLDAWRTVVGPVDATAVATAVVIWSRLHGLMLAELGRDVPEFGVEWASMFRFELNAMMRELFYAPQISTTQAE